MGRSTRGDAGLRWLMLALALAACSSGDDGDGSDGEPHAGSGAGSSGSGAAGAGGSGTSSGQSGAGGVSGRGGSGAGGASGSSGQDEDAGSGAGTGGTDAPAPDGGTTLGGILTVHLVPADGSSGAQRINFAVPLESGQLDDASQVRVLHDGDELATGRRALASYADGSVRSVQLQVELELSGETDLEVWIGDAPTTDELALVPVADTLVTADGSEGPRVWALLPAVWLSAVGFAGPLSPEAEVAGEPTAAWAALCDYDAWGLDEFLMSGYESDRAVWLFDRGTALYRGYARRGDLSPLRSAYIETAMYRNLITGSGTDARNGVPPDGAEDVKYTYAQNLALHYLLTGDDRFRDSAEDMALAQSVLWSDPGYAGGDDFWTERHAGFGLLAFVWAMIVSDDQSATFRTLADDAVDAYLAIQATDPLGYTDPDARCFAHTADAHGEGGAYFGCSPWMSAILADGMEQYARESDAARAEEVRDSLVKLGRIVAELGIQPDGRPYYFMGVGTDENMLDEYDEHLGESAYLMAMAWYYSGKNDAALRAAADTLVERLASDGTIPHVRSFNWQCRSAVAAPWFLR